MVRISVDLLNIPVLTGSPPGSPDGKRIAFTSTEAEDIDRKRPRIYVMDGDGKNRRKLSNEFVAEWHPSWSPDGRRIAFTSTGVMEIAGGPWDIYVMDADGGNRQRLSNDAGPGDWDPSWSPDGQTHCLCVSWGWVWGWHLRDGRRWGE